MVSRLQQTSHHPNPIPAPLRQMSQKLVKLAVGDKFHRPCVVDRPLDPSTVFRTSQQEQRQRSRCDGHAAQRREVLDGQVSVVMDDREPRSLRNALPWDHCVKRAHQSKAGQAPPRRGRDVRQVGHSRRVDPPLPLPSSIHTLVRLRVATLPPTFGPASPNRGGAQSDQAKRRSPTVAVDQPRRVDVRRAHEACDPPPPCNSYTTKPVRATSMNPCALSPQ